MKPTGFVRQLDGLGSVVVPQQSDGDQVQFPRARDGWLLQAGGTLKRAGRRQKNVPDAQRRPV